jgi:hypothetical protein
VRVGSRPTAPGMTKCRNRVLRRSSRLRGLAEPEYLPVMVLWTLLLLIVLLTICVCDVVFPRKMWGLFKAWRFKNPETVEPSDLVLWWYRVSGVLGAVLIVGVGVFGWTAYRGHARCEELLAELKNLYKTGGVSAVERRAHDLGLEVTDQTEAYSRSARIGRVVITEDGEPFATIWTLTSDAYCDA